MASQGHPHRYPTGVRSEDLRLPFSKRTTPVLIVYPDASTCRAFAEALEMPGQEEFRALLAWCEENITRMTGDGHTVLQLDHTGKMGPGLIVYSLRGSDYNNQKFFGFLVYNTTGSWAFSPYIHNHPLTPATGV